MAYTLLIDPLFILYMEDQYELCDWVEEGQRIDKAMESKLDKWHLYPFDANYFCLGDRQHINFDLVRCVPLEKLKIPERREDGRMMAVRHWARPENLTAVPMKNFRITKEFPRVHRIISIFDDTDDQPYDIDDGVRRTIVAREMNLSCLIAQAQESYVITKQDYEKL